MPKEAGSAGQEQVGSQSVVQGVGQAEAHRRAEREVPTGRRVLCQAHFFTRVSAKCGCLPQEFV